MHPRLSVNTIGYGPVPVARVLDELVAHGIRRIGVPVAQLEAGDLATNVAALAAHGLDVVDLVEPSVFTLACPDAWGAQRDRLCRCVDLAAEVGAPVLYVTTGPAGGLDWDEAALAFRDAVAPVLGHAAAAGVRIAVENTVTMRADIGFLHRLADTVDAAALAQVAVCADLFGAWTDRDLRGALLAGAERFALVQVADFVLGTTRTSDRAVPGDGDIPIARQLRWLAESGYAGPVELELLGPRITAEGPATAAARAATIVSNMLEQALG
jgi:sugar phosphate isomerase/epimerase